MELGRTRAAGEFALFKDHRYAYGYRYGRLHEDQAAFPGVLKNHFLGGTRVILHPDMRFAGCINHRACPRMLTIGMANAVHRHASEKPIMTSMFLGKNPLKFPAEGVCD